MSKVLTVLRVSYTLHWSFLCGFAIIVEFNKMCISAYEKYGTMEVNDHTCSRGKYVENVVISANNSFSAICRSAISQSTVSLTIIYAKFPLARPIL